MAINSNTDDGGEDAYGEEWEGGPIEVGPVKRGDAPEDIQHLDQELASLEANEPQPGDDTPQIDDPGISPIPQDSEQLLGQEVAELEAEKPFDFQGTASQSESPEVGPVDTEDYEPPESLGEYLKEVSKEPAAAEPTARQKRGNSRVPSNPPQGEHDGDIGSMDGDGASGSLQEADVRNRDTHAKATIDHMRKLEEITERLLAART